MLQHTNFILLDAARMGALIEEARLRSKVNDCLYRGQSEAALSGVAPHLFQYAHTTDFARWYLTSGWGDSWGVLLKSSWPFTELHKHFRKFLLIKAEDGQELYFRFYDPRVLRLFLPTCDTGQIRELFGGAIDYFIVEDEDPDFALRFSHQNGLLQTERFSVKDMIAALPMPVPLPPPPEDPLPPETIAALEAQGINLAELGMSSTVAQAEAKPKEAAPAQAAPTNPDVVSHPPKPKTKWNLFE